MIAKNTRSKNLILLAGLAMLTASAGFADKKIKRIFEERIDLTDVQYVEIKVFKGHIKAFGEERQDAELSITQKFKVSSEKEADRLEESIIKNIWTEDDTLYVEVDTEHEPSWFDKVFGNRNPINLDTKIILPNRMNIKLDTSGGHLSAHHFKGTVDLKTSGGHIEAEEIVGDLLADTSGGHITVSDIDGNAFVKTSGGHIEATNISGDAKLKTSGGHIEAGPIEGHLDARTSGGNVKAYLPNGIESDTTLRTSGGNVSVKMPENASFTIDASTSAGRVHSDFNVPTSRRIPGGKIKAEVNGGGATLRLKTSGGNVSVNRI